MQIFVPFSHKERSSDLEYYISSHQKLVTLYHKIRDLCQLQKNLVMKDGIFYFQQLFPQEEESYYFVI